MTTPKKIPGLADLVRMRDELVQGFKDVESLIKHLDDLADEVGIRVDWTHDRQIKDKVQKVDVGFWEYLIERAAVCDSMTVKARKEYMERVRTKAPKFEPKAIAALRENADRIYADGYTQTLKEVHRQFIGCAYNSGDRNFRKKDNLQKIENQFRIDGPIYWYGRMGRFDLHDGGCLEDLLTACYLMDDKPKPNIANNFYSTAYTGFRDSKDDTVVTPYFTVKAYKNGNQKITWNPDQQKILDKINRFGAEGQEALGDALRKRYKPEHFPHRGYDPDTVIENFDGGQDLQFYPTPPELVDRMVEWARTESDLRYLEPSAGDGAIAVELLDWISPENGGLVQAFEIDQERALALSARNLDGLKVEIVDFLKVKPEAWVPFDRILMNPPFHGQADAIHVLHAFRFLAPQGGLVAVMAAGIESSQTRTAKALRAAVQARGGRFEPNPPATFKAAGTMVRTVTLVIPPKT
jgi:predicted RNA methylase